MIGKSKVIAIIPARGDSKRLPKKNIKLLASRPLIYYTINAAKKSKLIDEVFVSTEDRRIAEISKKYRVKIIKRPKKLAKASIVPEEVLKHAILKIEKKYIKPNLVVLLQPTSPLRTSEDIDNTIKLALKNKTQSATSRNEEGKLNGAVYVVKTDYFLKTRSLYGPDHKDYVMPNERSIDIDYEKDFRLAEKILISKKLTRSCFIIAEVGVNHNGSIKIAKRLIDAAAKAGADAVKFQTFKSENLVTKNADVADYQEINNGKKQSQLNMLKNLELTYNDFKELKEYSDKKEIIFLSTPHTEDAVNFLDDMVPIFKIGSGDLTNLPFLEKVAKKGKPIILSTGMATLEEVKEAVSTIKKNNDQLILLHCTTNYPCSKKNVNLSAMKTLEKETNCAVGYSDHTLRMDVAIMAVSLGAIIIEKHFTLDKNMKGPDHKASLNPKELTEMIIAIRKNKKIKIPKEILGSGIKKPTEQEINIAKLIRKSIIAAENIAPGTKITKNMLIIKRPGTGIKPKNLNNVIGKSPKKFIEEDSLIRLSDLK